MITKEPPSFCFSSLFPYYFVRDIFMFFNLSSLLHLLFAEVCPPLLLRSTFDIETMYGLAYM